MRLAKQTYLACLVALVAGAAQAADGNGFTLDATSLHWPRWQGRLALGGLAGRSDEEPQRGVGSSTQSLALIGDYYLPGSLLGTRRSSGFRATSGIIVGARPQPWAAGVSSSPAAQATDRRLFGQSPWRPTTDAASDASATPYLGLGYSGASVSGGWSFTADLGLMSQTRNGAVKLGRAATGNQSLDDAVREMRWSPLLQLGVSYSF